MFCKECGVHYPKTYQESNCLECDYPLDYTAVEILSLKELGLVDEIRPSQIELTRLIEEAFVKNIKEGEPVRIFAEGGCGVGKTYAYSIPSLLNKGRVVICTGKKKLQDQLANKDIPALLSFLDSGLKAVNIKGRNNYICKRLVEKKRDEFIAAGATESDYFNLRMWLKEVELEDRELYDGNIPDKIAYQISAESCLKTCKISHTCGYANLKRKRRSADIIITNHTLVGFDLRCGNRIFDAYTTLIVDEAHAFADNLRSAFSTRFSSFWMQKTINKLLSLDVDLGNLDLTDAIETWRTLFIDMNADTNTMLKQGEEKLNAGFFKDVYLNDCLDNINDMTHYALMTLADLLKIEGACDMENDALLNKVNRALEQLQHDVREGDYSDDITMGDKLEYLEELSNVHDNLMDTKEHLLLTKKEDSNWMHVRRIERENPAVYRMPVVLGPLVAPALNLITRSVYTSATLNTELLSTFLGIKPTHQMSQPSPFNYKDNALLYLPRDAPMPNTPDWLQDISNEIHRLLCASKGNALVLFPAISELNYVFKYMDRNFDMPYTIYPQMGGMSPEMIMHYFLENDDAVIFGSKSFFEGVDVKGPKLRLVILVKIPFPHPNEALSNAVKSIIEPSDYWRKYILQRVKTDVLQAGGRLIRSHVDKGVFAILDPRMWVGSSKELTPDHVINGKRKWQGYGKAIANALPIKQIACNKATVIQYLENLENLEKENAESEDSCQ